MTASRPRALARLTAAARKRERATSSWLTSMRSAWKTRVAGSIFSRDPLALATMRASWRVVVIGPRPAFRHDPARDLCRHPFLPVFAENPRQFLDRRRRDDVRGAPATSAHAHVQRPVPAEGESARRRLELHRRDAEIGQDRRRAPGRPRADASSSPKSPSRNSTREPKRPRRFGARARARPDRGRCPSSRTCGPALEQRLARGRRRRASRPRRSPRAPDAALPRLPEEGPACARASQALPSPLLPVRLPSGRRRSSFSRHDSSFDSSS